MSASISARNAASAFCASRRADFSVPVSVECSLFSSDSVWLSCMRRSSSEKDGGDSGPSRFPCEELGSEDVSRVSVDTAEEKRQSHGRRRGRRPSNLSSQVSQGVLIDLPFDGKSWMLREGPSMSWKRNSVDWRKNESA